VLRHLRGKIATFTAHVRSIADRYDCPVLDLWSLKSSRTDALGTATGCTCHRRPTRVALRAAQVSALDVRPSAPTQPWPPLAPRGALECAATTCSGREYLVRAQGHAGVAPGDRCSRSPSQARLSWTD